MAATSSAGISNFGGDLRHAPTSAVETALPDEWNCAFRLPIYPPTQNPATQRFEQHCWFPWGQGSNW